MENNTRDCLVDIVTTKFKQNMLKEFQNKNKEDELHYVMKLSYVNFDMHLPRLKMHSYKERLKTLIDYNDCIPYYNQSVLANKTLDTLLHIRVIEKVLFGMVYEIDEYASKIDQIEKVPDKIKLQYDKPTRLIRKMCTKSIK